jgi:Fur family ferric uptake transcriptional regulator
MVQIKIKHDCKVELNDAKLRATPARIALMKLFESAQKPLDVQTMIEHLYTIGIKTDPATVFRIVNMFTEKGLLKTIQLNEGKFRYELASGTDHHHLVCTVCGDIEDISDCNISALEKEIEKKKGFLVVNHTLEFYGICRDCTAKQN